LAARKGHFLLFFTTISSQESASTNIHFSLRISSKISSLSDLIFPIHFTSGYFELARNGPNLPVFTTMVHSIPSGHGFHSYLALRAFIASLSSFG